MIITLIKTLKRFLFNNTLINSILIKTTNWIKCMSKQSRKQHATLTDKQKSDIK